MAMKPEGQEIFFLLIVAGGVGSGFFEYDVNGNLRAADVGQTGPDPVQGITCQQGRSTFNGHGAVVTLNDTARSAEFLYIDTGTAAQGALFASEASKSGTDPIKGTHFPLGFKIFLPPSVVPAEAEFSVLSGGLCDGWWVPSADVSNFPLGPAVPTDAETWHAMALQNSWSNAGGTLPAARYRLIASPPNSVEIDGVITHAAIAGSSQIFTLPAAYVPASGHNVACDFVSAGAGWAPAANWPPRIVVDTSGNLTATNLPANTTEISFHGVFPLD